MAVNFVITNPTCKDTQKKEIAKNNFTNISP